MCTAMAIYGIDTIPTEKAYEIGRLFFDVIGLDATIAIYPKYKEDRSEGDIDFIEVSLPKLKDEIKNNNVTNFRFFHESKSNRYWKASFGYSTNTFGAFSHIDAQFASAESEYKCLEFIKKLSAISNFCYGIIYHPNNVGDGFFYAQGGNFVKVFSNEDPLLFSKWIKCTSDKCYQPPMLRMVYPFNVISQQHLDTAVMGDTLNEWILRDKKHGVLEKLSDRKWLWTVADSDLDAVNKLLGEAGILISWRPFNAKKRVRKLP